MDSRNIRNPYHGVDDLQSDFGDDVAETSRKKRRNDFMEKELPGQEPKKKRNEGRAGFEEEHGRMHRRMAKMMSMNAYDRHKEMINLYYLSYPGSTKLLNRTVQNEKTDYDVLKEHHKFVWNPEDDGAETWETRMARKYYEKLFKEYCIVDLSMYKTNKIGMRWRTETEVKDGKGQLICGARKCDETSGLASWEFSTYSLLFRGESPGGSRHENGFWLEYGFWTRKTVNFSYKEDNRSKNALVKARLCRKCSDKLNYGTQKRQVKQKKRAIRKWEKARKRRDSEQEIDEDELEKEEDHGKKEKTNEPSTSSLSASTDIWEGPAPSETEKTVDDEIDEFLDDLFL